MTINNAKATTHACPARPTTKSVCPEGAGLIDNASAHESAHTPPQACAAPPSCATAQQPRESLPAQLAEGYEHLFKTHQRLLQLMELISSDSYAASFQSLGQYRAALLEEAGKHVFEWPKLDRPAKVGSVEAAEERLSHAQQDLVAAVAAAYPKDTIVTAKLGGRLLQLSVEGPRGAYWVYPGQMIGVNIETGKARTFYDRDAVSIDHMPRMLEPQRETLFKPGEGEALMSLTAGSAAQGGEV